MEFSQNAFAAPSRTLTGLSSNVMTTGGAGNTTLAAGATVDLAPAAAVFRQASVVIKTGGTSTGTAVINLTDGTTPIIMATAAAAGGVASINGACNSPTQRVTITNNDGAIASNYIYAVVDWHQ